MMNTLERFSLAEEAKKILVEMAIDGTLPVDMNELDMDDILTKADLNLSNDENHVRLEMLNKLGEYVSADTDEERSSMLDILLNAEDENEITGWMDGITMVQRYETSFTVADLLETIS